MEPQKSSNWFKSPTQFEYPSGWVIQCPEYSETFIPILRSCKSKSQFKKIIKEVLIEEQNGLCPRCDKRLNLDNPKNIHLHHIDYSGGTDKENNDPSNLIVIHGGCHQVTHLKFKRGRATISQGKFFENELMKATMRFLKWRYILRKVGVSPPENISWFVWYDGINRKEYRIRLNIEQL